MTARRPRRRTGHARTVVTATSCLFTSAPPVASARAQLAQNILAGICGPMEFECDRSAKANATAKVRTPRTSEVSKENRGAVRRTVASYVDLLFLQVSVVISRGCGRRCPCTAKYADKFCIVALNREGIGTAGATLLDR